MALGNRIRRLRKEKNLTLEALAGDQLTKGMLSLIENDKAQPSLESLTYIAEKLGVEKNELLQEVSASELRGVASQITTFYNQGEYQKVIDVVRSKFDGFPDVFEAGKVLEIYGLSLLETTNPEWDEVIQKANKIYMAFHDYNASVSLILRVIQVKITLRDYEQAYDILMKKKEEIMEVGATIDTLNEVTIKHNEIMLLFAIDRYHQATELLEETIDLYRQKSLFYKIDNLYRVACFYSMMSGKKEKMNHYMEKLEAYGDFSDHTEIKSYIWIIKAHYYNTYEKNIEKALHSIEKFKETSSNDPTGGWVNYYVMEKGKSLFWLGEYEEAISYLEKFNEVPEWTHPFDLSIMYELYAVMARCYLQLNKIDEATAYVNKATKGVEDLPPTPYKTFVLDTQKLIDGE